MLKKLLYCLYIQEAMSTYCLAALLLGGVTCTPRKSEGGAAVTPPSQPSQPEFGGYGGTGGTEAVEELWELVIRDVESGATKWCVPLLQAHNHRV